MFAKELIKKGEVVSIKGGYLMDKTTLIRHEDIVNGSELQVTDDIFLGGKRLSVMIWRKLCGVLSVKN